jgi:hypothetical protein
MITEGNTGTVNATFTVTLSKPSTAAHRRVLRPAHLADERDDRQRVGNRPHP